MTPIDLLKATRKNILGLCEGLSHDQLNLIPDGFNNNLIWNAGHVIATMELLTYGLAGLPLPSGTDFVDRYRKGTRPVAPASSSEIGYILKAQHTSIQQLEQDLETADFGKYRAYATSYGVTIASIKEAMVFNNMHEAMHIGSMIALRKFV